MNNQQPHLRLKKAICFAKLITRDTFRPMPGLIRCAGKPATCKNASGAVGHLHNI